MYRLKAINAANAPLSSRLNTVTCLDESVPKLEIIFEDGCSMDQGAKWRSLFYHSMALHCDNADETGEATVKHDSINFRTDTAEPDPVTSIQVSGQIVVTGHETGYVY